MSGASDSSVTVASASDSGVSTEKQKTLFQLVSTITASLTAASGPEMDNTIEHALAVVGQFFDADRSYLFQFNADCTLARNTHEWCAEGVSAHKESLQALDTTVLSGFMEPLLLGETQAIDDISMLPTGSNERQLLEAQAIQSVIMVPVMAGPSFLAMFGLDIVRSIHHWQENTIAALQLLAANLASGLIRKDAEHQVEQLAFYDPLTSLPNRRLLTERLDQTIKQSERTRRVSALMLIDLDHFKDLNDSLGHQLGDQYLQMTGAMIREQLRITDTVARQGGDEFIVLLGDVDSDLSDAALQSRRVAETILTRVNQPVQLGNNVYQSSVSIGMTLFNGQNKSVTDLMKQIEMAMYRAKSAGRNSIAFFDPDMQAHANQRAMLTQDLHTAIRENQFHLYFQPIVSLAMTSEPPGTPGDTTQSNVSQLRMTGVEALIRWEHPGQGNIAPDQFIPFAEETGLIVAIGDWVLREACQQLASWQKQSELCKLCCSVNISAFQFSRADFVEKVTAAITLSGVDPRGLKLELTETMLVADIAMVQDKMQKLQTLGVSFSLDDFGTGYCSLSYLHQLPISQLKIDQKFVRNIHQNPGNLAITKAILALADSLDLDTVAEGVETRDELQQLQLLNCRSFQGYFFSRPVTADVIHTTKVTA